MSKHSLIDLKNSLMHLISEKYGLDSSRKLNQVQYQELCDFIELNKQNKSDVEKELFG